jgi:Cu-processing system ATP-binding protein
MNMLGRSPSTSTDAVSAIVARGLTKEYGRHRAVDGVDFSVPKGTTLALIGHNGAGKTTLMKMILGLVRPSSGTLEVLGKTPASAGLRFRQQLGFLPENVAFHDELTGAQTLRFYARLKGSDLASCGTLLERVGLTFASERKVKTYSKGMRQRLGLAQALLGSPELLLLDEPTTGLDPTSRAEFFRIVHELSQRGATVIISSHILTELEARTDLIAIMNSGRLAAYGEPDGLRRAANLPIKIVVVSQNQIDPVLVEVKDLVANTIPSADGCSAEIWCSVENKMPVLSRLTSLGRVVADIDIRQPGLDEIYRHFSQRADDVPGGAT